MCRFGDTPFCSEYCRSVAISTARCLLANQRISFIFNPSVKLCSINYKVELFISIFRCLLNVIEKQTVSIELYGYVQRFSSALLKLFYRVINLLNAFTISQYLIENEQYGHYRQDTNNGLGHPIRFGVHNWRRKQRMLRTFARNHKFLTTCFVGAAAGSGLLIKEDNR